MQMRLSRRFDWDAGNLDHCRKHGVSIAEIENLLGGGDAMISPDPHSGEERFRAAGRTHAGRVVFVVFTLRRCGDETLVRPVSARFMHQKEVANYEKAVSHLRH